jgi:ABC-type lipoprotein export system ATPase subunit
VVVASHDLRIAEFADRVIKLEDGAITQIHLRAINPTLVSLMKESLGYIALPTCENHTVI